MAPDRVLLISIDSLRRDVLSTFRDQPRGFGYPVETPHLDRFADRSAIFTTHYAGSLPCMPARREWLTGVQEFLWRSWGPIEPFDHPLPRVIRDAGTPTQLITDHFHYFQHGAGGYYEDYNGFQFIRGHEADHLSINPRRPGSEAFRRQVNASDPDDLAWDNRIIYARNAAGLEREEDFFAARVFTEASKWIGTTDWDRWFLYVDSFDVHEPFHNPEPYASMYTDEDPTDPDLPLWPFYGHVNEPADSGPNNATLTERQVDFVRSQFAGKTTMTDRWFGHLIETLDSEERWNDTVVIVTSDHGHFLGDHGWMGKPLAPMYNVLAHTPLFIWHPDSPRMGERINALTSAVDIYATICDLFGLDDVPRRHSQSLLPLLMGEREDHRDAALYGYWGSSVNVTDGTYTYLHPTDPDVPVELYSTEMMNPSPYQFDPRTPKREAEVGSLPYTDTPVWRYTAEANERHPVPMLFDVERDPGQEENLADSDEPAERRMRELLVESLTDLDAPANVYQRLGLGATAE